jgi:aminomethyltransferase
MGQGSVMKTPLYDEHVRAGARMMPFAGFLMPVQYTGIIEEHKAVRRVMGMFDLSHMGELRLTGDNRQSAVDRLMTNDILGMDEWQVRYTPMCYSEGGIVDDLLVYRFPDHLLLVVNASNIQKDLAWIRQNLADGVQAEDVSGDTALIAIQGPSSEAFLQAFADVDLGTIGYYRFANGLITPAPGHRQAVPALISRTGYTGEDGFELYLRSVDASAVWSALLEAGRPQGLMPVGLGARDTLRLEAGYMLYGNDIDENTNPLEAGLGWTVKFRASGFVGQEALERQKEAGLMRRMTALEMTDRAIPRQHHAVLAAGARVGELTSGTFSPTFERGIGLGYVSADSARTGTELQVEIRDALHPARVVKRPMYKRAGG